MISDSDQERFMRLWTSAQDAVANYIHVLVRDHSAVKDVLQDTALLAFRGFAEYDGNRPFVAWALGIARYQVLSMRRDHMRCVVTYDEELLNQFTDTWSELAPAVSDRGALLQSCIKRLAGHAQKIVKLRYYEELNSAQIAERLGGNAAAIRVTLQRIREQLRLCMERKQTYREEPS